MPQEKDNEGGSEKETNAGEKEKGPLEKVVEHNKEIDKIDHEVGKILDQNKPDPKPSPEPKN